MNLLRRLVLSAAMLSPAAAIADPLGDLLIARSGFACFERVYDTAHLAKIPRQKTQSIRLLLTELPSFGQAAGIRVSVFGKLDERHIVGECRWSDEPAMGAQGEPFIDTYKAGAGLLCHAYASSDGASAEEGGDFVAELRTRDRIILHLPEDIAGWPSYDTDVEATFFPYGVDDRVFRLDRADDEICDEMDTHLPSAADIVLGDSTGDNASRALQPPKMLAIPGVFAKP